MLHVVDHIRRFGPAALFATEAFESFNAVIRAKSIHSNHCAPSRDIARSFAHGSRIRHILSGARILIHENTDIPSDSPDLSSDKPADAINVKVVGKGPLLLVQRPNIITDYLGLDTQTDTTKYGKVQFYTSSNLLNISIFRSMPSRQSTTPTILHYRDRENFSQCTSISSKRHSRRTQFPHLQVCGAF